ncbi:homocysteine S-methyltransferase family protein [Butyrivibrio sp. INlla16]|uniref:homocysteine S-methyltransferase family protein n=1 Tax=Butyrivibrio sp. INlla16 TaxID=1520807 RepID=UPI00088CB6B6|nr:homocysteine S-methyltransferase family protein [Butyrivibrio sp. INlla16]SDB17001.1 5-methyltetrahydrofolate--homocysteine methyltransferase [Butyrivibrio sp. INlla16]
MKRDEFISFIQNKKIAFLDGATGTNLMKEGLPAGACTEEWILENPEVIKKLQKSYVEAGSDIIYAPTFTGNRIKLKNFGLEDRIEEINTKLVELAKESAEGKALIAGDITMTGRQLKPMGDLDFEELIEVYKEQITILCKAGIDVLVVETMMSLQECRAALIAAKEVSDIAVMVTLTFEGDGRTLFGTDAKTAAIVIESLGAAAVGANCGTGPDNMVGLIADMASVTTIPIIAKPNAGLPVVTEDGTTEYDMECSVFVPEMEKLIKAGATIIGGCCGTSPEYIKGIHEKYHNYELSDKVIRKTAGVRYLTSERSSIAFGMDDPFMIVGERINPTGKKKLQAELREGNLNMVCDFVSQQEEDGASILDVNVGMSGIDERQMMSEVLDEIIPLTSLPLCIDTSDEATMEMALRKYPGRALINSISLEKDKAERFLPLAKKYGAMFIALPVGPKGLPKDMEEKHEFIDALCDKAYNAGLSKEDIVVDGLVATIGANPNAALETLATISYCKERNLATICGLSNISFGLPQRAFINTAFLTMAIANGLTMAICNPSQELLVNSAFASDLLRHKEEADIRYIDRMNRYDGMNVAVTCVPKGQAVQTAAAQSTGKDSASATNVGSNNNESVDDPVTSFKKLIKNDVMKGSKRTIDKDTEEAVNAGCNPKELLNEVLMPAINEVGELFDKGKYFLPQLIASAEAMKLSIGVLEPLLKEAEGEDSKAKETIVIATVHGDIHDIGKNLVALMLKNHGFNVIDLGKDVPSEKIVDTAITENAGIIALSALMTTTMQEMKNVVKLAGEKKCKAKIIIGGAVVTEDYAWEIGADGYSSDAASAVKVVKNILSEAEKK